jgi:outer membrane biosynthesis protein TonB
VREAIDDVIAFRAHDPSGLSRALAWSYAVHGFVFAALLVFPRAWMSKPKPAEHVMTITLGGLNGPKESGPTTIGGRPVEEAAPQPKRPEPIKPVATKSDAMIVPTKVTPPKKAPPKVEEKANMVAPAPVPARSTGPEKSEGNSRVETGVRGMGTGLELGGPGAGGAAGLTDFCCPAYLNDIRRRIESKWDPHQSERGLVKVQFTIHRGGQVTDFSVVQPGTFLLNRASEVPFMGLQLPPLPAEYKDASLTLRLTFEYR